MMEREDMRVAALDAALAVGGSVEGMQALLVVTDTIFDYLLTGKLPQFDYSKEEN